MIRPSVASLDRPLDAKLRDLLQWLGRLIERFQRSEGFVEGG